MQASTKNEPAEVLVLEDDKEICDLIDFNLSAAGFKVKTVETMRDARLALSLADFDLMITDVRLPDGNGLEFSREIMTTSKMGIIVMTGAGDEIDRIVGLELGADDYINKPFHQRELVARTRAVLRRLRQINTSDEEVTGGAQDAEPITFHGYSLFKSNRLVTDKLGRPVTLTTMEFDVLAVLAANKNKTMSRSQIYDAALFRSENDGRLIDGVISRLRKKLFTDNCPSARIRTIHGRGYSLAD